MKRKETGMVSVWLSLILLLLLSLLMVTAESVRYTGLRSASILGTRLASEGMLAAYCTPLWEEYGILGASLLSAGEEGAADETSLVTAMTVLAGDNLSASFFTCAPAVTRVGYTLLGDDGASALVRQGAAMSLSGLGGELLAALPGRVSAEEASDPLDELLENGKQAEQQAKEEAAAKAQEAQAAGEGAEAPNAGQNPPPAASGKKNGEGEDGEKSIITQVLEWKEKAVLAQILPEVQFPSDERIDQKAAEGSFSGTMALRSPSVTEKGLFQLYLMTKMSRFTDQKTGRLRHLELEHILFDKHSDRADLEAMVWRLLALREVSNLTALMADGVRVAEAEALAAAIAAGTATPALIGVIRTAILAAWAYLESVLDIRLLLSGGKVPLMKTHAEWTSDLKDLPSCFSVERKARPAALLGISYEGYLFSLLSSRGADTLGERTLAVMEAQVRQSPGYETADLSHMVVALETDWEISAGSLFPVWVGVQSLREETWRWQISTETAYLETETVPSEP